MVVIPLTPLVSLMHRSVMAMAMAGRNIPTTISEAEPFKSSDESLSHAKAASSKPGGMQGVQRGGQVPRGGASSPTKGPGGLSSPKSKKIDSLGLGSLLQV